MAGNQSARGGVLETMEDFVAGSGVVGAGALVDQVDGDGPR
jgi:hypothetical protein